MRQTTKAEVCLDEGKSTSSGPARRATRTIGCERGWLRPNCIAMRLEETENRDKQQRNTGNAGLMGVAYEIRNQYRLPKRLPEGLAVDRYAGALGLGRAGRSAG